MLVPVGFELKMWSKGWSRTDQQLRKDQRVLTGPGICLEIQLNRTINVMLIFQLVHPPKTISRYHAIRLVSSTGFSIFFGQQVVFQS
jgi:hypothetical protein